MKNNTPIDRRTVSILIDALSFYMFDGMTPSEVIHTIKDVGDPSNHKNAYDNLRFEVTERSMELYGERLENDQEYNERKRAERASLRKKKKVKKLTVEQKERRMRAKLKKKYENN